MTQPTMTMRNRGIRVVSGLLVCMGLLLMLLPGAGALPPAQAQEPDVSAALTTITRNVSGSVTFVTPCYNFSGSLPIPLSGNATVSQVVQVKAGSEGAVVGLKLTANLNSAVPISVYVGNPGCTGGTASLSSANMSGSNTATSSIGVYIGSNQTAQLSISVNVPVSGSKSVSVSGTRGVYIYALNQPIYGTATIQLIVYSGSATFPLYAYLPLIARQDTPAGGAWSDNFSSDKGWRAIISDNCDVGVDNDTLRVKLKKTAQVPEDICWITAPVNNGPLLAQGTFQVSAVRTTDKKASYALIFNATTSLLEHHWQLGASPWDGSEGCSGQAGIWLSYIDKGVGPGDRWPTCTSVLKRGKNEWNTLKVVRRSDSVEGYINGEKKIEADDEDAPYLKDAGLFDLAVWGEKDAEIRFDNFSVTP